MSIWSKVLIGLIFFSVLPMFYLAANNMGAQQAWRTKIQELQAQLDPLLETNQRLAYGDEPARLAPLDAELGPFSKGTPGIAQLKLLLHDAVLDRGRVWMDCQRNQVDPANGQLSVTVPTPVPHQIQEKTVLYLFQQRDRQDGGGYLGAFVVSGVADTTVALTPAMTLNQRELDRLANSQDSLVLYETMPADRHGVFAGLSEDELNQLLPESSREEYTKHGRPAAEAQAPEERVFEGVYERKLRDYAKIFREAHHQMAKLQSNILANTTDLGFVKAAEAAAKGQIQSHDNAILQLQALLKETQEERNLVQAHRQALESRLDAVQQKVQETFDANKALAGQWTAAQKEAVQRAPGTTGAAAATLGRLP